MASILKPTKEIFIDNCPVLHVTDNMPTEHPPGFDEYPNFFCIEVFENTRVDVEVPSDNNPLGIKLTGNIKHI